MIQRNRHLIRRMLLVLFITIAVGGTMHLVLVTAMSIIRQDISYINPLDFLGLSYIFPEYRESRFVATIGWLLLIIFYFIIMYIHLHYRLYISIISKTRAGKQLLKITQPEDKDS